MNRRFFIIILETILLGGLLFSSCGKNEEESYFSVTPQMVTVSGNGEVVALSVTSNVSWSVSSDASFVSVSPSSGEGTASVSLSVAANTTGALRTAEIVFKFKGKNSLKVFLSQEPASDSAYEDGEVKVYQKSNKQKPFVLVFSGDGYTKDMFDYEIGKFDKDINKAIEALFSIEPYKTYRDYFTVYKVAAFSNEAGVSIKRPAREYKDTRFKCMWERTDVSGASSTLIECDMDAVAEFWKKVPGLTTDEAQTYAPFCIIVNSQIDAGTVNVVPSVSNISTATHFGGVDFKTVSMVPLGGEKQSFETILKHELGGHGIGLLSDEYSFNSYGAIPDAQKEQLIAFQNWGPLGFGWNLTFSDDESSAPWSQLLAESKYQSQGIGMYEGGMNFSKGVWRSSWDSMMKGNKPYFNVQSRWLIYKRIKFTVGENASLADFMANDKETQFELAGSAANGESSNDFAPAARINSHVVFLMR